MRQCCACLLVCPSVCLPACLPAYLSVFVSVSVHLSVSPSVHLPSADLCVCPPASILLHGKSERPSRSLHTQPDRNNYAKQCDSLQCSLTNILCVGIASCNACSCQSLCDRRSPAKAGTVSAVCPSHLFLQLNCTHLQRSLSCKY